jgi:hypothetical protein
LSSIQFLYPISGNGSKLRDILISTCQGRLTPTSGTPIETNDATSISTISWAPLYGRQVALFDGLDWKTISGSNVGISVPNTRFQLFDIFGYDGGGFIDLETYNWNTTIGTITNATNTNPITVTSNSHGLVNNDVVGIAGISGNTNANGVVWKVSGSTTNTFILTGSSGNGAYTSGGNFYKILNTRATTLTILDGIYVKLGDPTRRYLGTASTTDVAGQTEYSKKRRLIWNQYNRISSPLRLEDTDSLWPYSGTWRQANNKVSNRVEVVIGLPESSLDLRLITAAAINSSNAWSGIGEDSLTPDPLSMGGYYGGNNIGVEVAQQGVCELTKYPTLGYHFYQWLEQCDGTTIFYGSATDYRSGLIGKVLG